MDEYLDSFLVAASTVLQEELKMGLLAHKLEKEHGPFETEDISVILAIQGEIEGQLLFCLNYETARSAVNRIVGPIDLEAPEMHEMLLSGVAELGNIIAGRAIILLETVGKRSSLAPPAVLYKRDVIISTLDVSRYKILFNSEIGDFVLQVGLRCRS